MLHLWQLYAIFDFFFCHSKCLVNCLEPNSKSLFFEPYPVLLEAIDCNDNFFENIGISLTKVVFKKRVAIGKVSIKSFLVLGQPNDLSDILQL